MQRVHFKIDFDAFPERCKNDFNAISAAPAGQGVGHNQAPRPLAFDSFT